MLRCIYFIALLYFGGLPLADAQVSQISCGKLPKFLDEVSGMAQSPRLADRFWAHNDSGDSLRIYSFRGDCEKFEFETQLTLGAEHKPSQIPGLDLEDMSSGWFQGEPYIFLADTGNNLGQRGESKRRALRIFRFVEPQELEPAKQRLASNELEFLELRYAGGAEYDSEALIYRPKLQELWLLAKSIGGKPSRDFFRIDLGSPLWRRVSKGVFENSPKARRLELKPETLSFQFEGLVTAASFSPSLSQLALRTYSHVLMFDLSESGELSHRASAVNIEKQAESLFFYGPSAGLLSSSESSRRLRQFQFPAAK